MPAGALFFFLASWYELLHFFFVAAPKAKAATIFFIIPFLHQEKKLHILVKKYRAYCLLPFVHFKSPGNHPLVSGACTSLKRA
jgi:hypothetical protein